MVTRGLQHGREVWIGEAQEIVEDREIIGHDTTSVNSWHYSSIKTHWTSKHMELILRYENLKIFLMRLEESQNGIQNVTRLANYLTNI